MKRIILAAVAASMALSPLAITSAQAAEQRGRHVVQERHYQPDRRHTVTKKIIVKKQVTHRWGKGQRVSDWRNRKAVRDYNRYGLRKPGRGQQWVKVDNDYLLISLSSGIIAGILAGR